MIYYYDLLWYPFKFLNCSPARTGVLHPILAVSGACRMTLNPIPYYFVFFGKVSADKESPRSRLHCALVAIRAREGALPTSSWCNAF